MKLVKQQPEPAGVTDNCESITDIHNKSKTSATSWVLTLRISPPPRSGSQPSGLATAVLAIAFASADLCLEKATQSAFGVAQSVCREEQALLEVHPWYIAT